MLRTACLAIPDDGKPSAERKVINKNSITPRTLVIDVGFHEIQRLTVMNGTVSNRILGI